MKKVFLFLLVALALIMPVATGYSAPVEMMSSGGDALHHYVPVWLVIPFVLLLVMIATGPLFYEHFWHQNYPLIAMILAGITISYYIVGLGYTHSVIHSLAEYVQFIALIGALYIASGGIMIEIDKEATPKANILLLIIGALMANLIGTTGASMLLIRPYIRLNQSRLKAYHVIFFIFIVSNIGGSLTPIGDPPLFLGFLKGVPFFWTAVNNVFPWAFALGFLITIFYFVDINNKTRHEFHEEIKAPTGKIKVKGKRNFIFLALIIACVFLDPNFFHWVPHIEYDGSHISLLREILLFGLAGASYRFAKVEAIRGNQFSFEPIREVAFIFIGIFGTMMPAMELVGNYASSPEGAEMITQNTLFWGTGILSGFLDNAPTYLNFLTAALASQGMDISNHDHVVDFAAHQILNLKAISVAAVFFGAFTYIGNGPNFMVKSIAEEIGLKMPSFFGYILRYSLLILLPLYLLVWLLFFRFG